MTDEEEEKRHDRSVFPMNAHLESAQGCIIPVEPPFDDHDKEEFLRMFARYIKANVKLTRADLQAFQESDAFEWMHQELLPEGQWGAPDVELGADHWVDDFRYLPNRVKVYFAPSALRYHWYPHPRVDSVELVDVLRLVNYGVGLGMIPPEVFVWLQPIHRRSDWPLS